MEPENFGEVKPVEDFTTSTDETESEESNSAANYRAADIEEEPVRDDSHLASLGLDGETKDKPKNDEVAPNDGDHFAKGFQTVEMKDTETSLKQQSETKAFIVTDLNPINRLPGETQRDQVSVSNKWSSDEMYSLTLDTNKGEFINPNEVKLVPIKERYGRHKPFADIKYRVEKVQKWIGTCVNEAGEDLSFSDSQEQQLSGTGGVCAGEMIQEKIEAVEEKDTSVPDGAITKSPEHNSLHDELPTPPKKSKLSSEELSTSSGERGLHETHETTPYKSLLEFEGGISFPDSEDQLLSEIIMEPENFGEVKPVEDLTTSTDETESEESNSAANYRAADIKEEPVRDSHLASLGLDGETKDKPKNDEVAPNDGDHFAKGFQTVEMKDKATQTYSTDLIVTDLKPINCLPEESQRDQVSVSNKWSTDEMYSLTLGTTKGVFVNPNEVKLMPFEEVYERHKPFAGIEYRVEEVPIHFDTCVNEAGEGLSFPDSKDQQLSGTGGVCAGEMIQEKIEAVEEKDTSVPEGAITKSPERNSLHDELPTPPKKNKLSFGELYTSSGEKEQHKTNTKEKTVPFLDFEADENLFISQGFDLLDWDSPKNLPAPELNFGEDGDICVARDQSSDD